MNVPLQQLHRARPRPVFKAPVPVSGSPLGNMLVADGVLAATDLIKALAIQTNEAARLGDILVAQGMVARNDVENALARQYGMRRADLVSEPCDPRLMRYVDGVDCLALNFVPWRIEGGAVVLAIAHPDTIRAVKMKLPPSAGAIRFVLSPRRQIHDVIHAHKGTHLIARAQSRVPVAMSCRSWSTGRSLTVTACCLLVMFAALWIAPVGTLTTLYGLAIITLACNTGLKIASILLSVLHRPTRSPVAGRLSDTLVGKPMRLPKISILVPLYREQNIASALVTRLERIDYPRELLEICLVVEADDLVTRKALRWTELPEWMRIIRVPLGALKTKPRAMNYALDYTTGTIIGVYDAEDAPDTDQLHRVVRKFHEGGPDLACVQGVLSFYNGHTNWLSRCFAFEYAAWFRIMLPGLQRLKLALPLGGTTLFFRRDKLVELGAWDAHNVTEDADLGMRLARRGWRTEMVQTVTQEEANSHLWPWVRQRSRWLKGYAITWCVHMRAPRTLWRDLGPRRFAGFQVLFLGTLISFLVAPVLWWGVITTLTGLPHPLLDKLSHDAGVCLIGFFLGSEMVTLSLFALAAARLENPPAMIWIITMPVYFVFGSIAAFKGIIELFFKPFYWDKTSHGAFGGDDEDAGLEENTLSTSDAVIDLIVEEATGVDLETGLEGHGKMAAQRR